MPWASRRPISRPRRGAQRLQQLGAFVDEGFPGRHGLARRAHRGARRSGDAVAAGPHRRVARPELRARRPIRAPCWHERERAAISVYAQGRDYHEVVKTKLKALGRFIWDTYRHEIKVFVDTAPLMEKPAAQAAGLGWQGKHTNLVSRQFGLVAVPRRAAAVGRAALRRSRDRPLRPLPRLPRCLPDQRLPGALPARCAALHLLSHHRARRPDRRGAAPAARQPHLWLRRLPRRLPVEQVRAKRPRGGLHARAPSSPRPRWPSSRRSTTPAFRQRFAGTAVKRIGRDRFMRNVAYALGNSGAPEAVPAVQHLLNDKSPLVREAAGWALSRLTGEFA